MTLYQVDFTYNEPSWGNVEITADSEAEALELSLDSIKTLYPEAQDIEVTGTKAID